ncbi:hypothetical protein CEUSTIGMA_g9687.t1 [Chlamydomonas eustigma]|uniref:Uncharacterized protein n=1 Tax=Chlamydomonas eustigma TaxID=1157962 RepID=A0A250XH64_9CHLO|nr:hypothetical protein CEUSTIGMA_g9687.t1 [Chlamydomonas eustigma]|eukprot:GAX82259.1 hypothetical protein CEUSTIGMA_g9687.t1 [Chlamydomonas eustigma]
MQLYESSINKVRSQPSPASPSQQNGLRKHSPWTATRQRKKNKQTHDLKLILYSEDDEVDEEVNQDKSCSDAVDDMERLWVSASWQGHPSQVPFFSRGCQREGQISLFMPECIKNVKTGFPSEPVMRSCPETALSTYFDRAFSNTDRHCTENSNARQGEDEERVGLRAVKRRSFEAASETIQLNQLVNNFSQRGHPRISVAPSALSAEHPDKPLSGNVGAQGSERWVSLLTPPDSRSSDMDAAALSSEHDQVNPGQSQPTSHHFLSLRAMSSDQGVLEEYMPAEKHLPLLKQQASLLTPTGCLEMVSGSNSGLGACEEFRISTVLTCGSKISLADSSNKLSKRQLHRREVAEVEQPMGTFQPAVLQRNLLERRNCYQCHESPPAVDDTSSESEYELVDEMRGTDWDVIPSTGRKGTHAWVHCRPQVTSDEQSEDDWSVEEELAMELGGPHRLLLEELCCETPQQATEGLSIQTRAEEMLASRRMAMKLAGIDRDDTSPDASEEQWCPIQLEQLSSLDDFNAYLSRAAEKGDRGCIELLWGEICNKGIRPNKFTLNMIMRCLAKSWACPLEAELLAREVSKAGGFTPDATSLRLIDSMHIRYEQLCG